MTTAQKLRRLKLAVEMNRADVADSMYHKPKTPKPYELGLVILIVIILILFANN